MALDYKKEKKSADLVRDTRPYAARVYDWMGEGVNGGAFILIVAFTVWTTPFGDATADLLFVLTALYFWWLMKRNRAIVFKLPMGAKWKDKNNEGPGRSGKAEGILYLGNMKKTNQEIWFTNSDARTHILYLGTTGAGKTEGLKSMVTNALTWGSGFVYIDGKADTDLWSSLSSLVRRFGRDDDLLVLNYMTGNSDLKAPSNTMNPFSSGSSSYLTNMLVSLMPEAEGDNAMWKERAVSLIGAIMPALTWKRDHQEIPMSVSTIRDFMTLPAVVKLAREQAIPEEIRRGIRSYLDTLPGYVDAAFDDEGRDKPGGPDGPPIDTTTARQQHGYLAMQFTRALQSLGDSYGYIFDTQAADVDMVDVVLNRRILVVLIPALEKSNDEIANLGKIVAATIKGMMGSTLGATVEGDTDSVIENKPTRSATPFMTVFDEVGYYAAAGMAVMAAQARSLGFCLVFSGQDLPAMRKRMKEEVNSIVANCNIKLFGKLEDPTETKDFFEKTVGSALVVEASGYKYAGSDTLGFFQDTGQGSIQTRSRASYDGLRALKEGEAVVTFGERVIDGAVFYCNPGHAKAMRVTRFLALPPPDKTLIANASKITRLRDLMVHKAWTAAKADVALETEAEIGALAQGLKTAAQTGAGGLESGIFAVTSVYALSTPIE
ncbi:MAG TPA: type IV secretion system DNA-binding domain-containing protein, partial [Alphaproteobacteria bacterium]|nr:type IV secretion system DNA-binding domain-containing protein [Alphaproteobacteria bacterium]